MLVSMAASVGVYIHIPFCKHRCGYCDFTTFARMEPWMERYVDALCEEIQMIAGGAPGDIEISSIFFGGGTPSILPASSLGRILVTVRDGFSLGRGCEISLEANPGTVNFAQLAQMRESGFNRLSLGMQSADPRELVLMERIHSMEEVHAAVRDARNAGFDNINLDLIYGIPGQKPETWDKSLHSALELEPDHLSLYGLSIEDGTPFDKLIQNGQMPDVDEDVEADLYELACAKLESYGYYHYEISNWARTPDFTCRHNLQYWRNLSYFGFGTGAHGYINGIRTRNAMTIPGYIKAMRENCGSDFPASPACIERTAISRAEAIKEHMMLGLRLLEEGVNVSDFEHRFGQPLNQVFPAQLKRLETVGLLEIDEECVRLSQKAWLLGNQVFAEFF